MPDAHAQSNLVLWLKGNIIAMLVFSMSLVGSAAGGVWATSRWVSSLESRVSAAQSDIIAAGRDAAGLHADIVSLDHRVNELREHVAEVRSDSLLAEQSLKAQLDAARELSKFNTDRTFQTPLPQGPRR